MDIKIELSGENILCCLDRPDEWYKRRGYNRSYNTCSEAPKFFVKKYNFDGKIRNNYLSNFVFGSNCHIYDKIVRGSYTKFNRIEKKEKIYQIYRKDGILQYG